ncbi:cytochrome c maturation protein CcmE [Sphingobacterium sp. SGG-5]|uniref:cytochrome c maturation protein CcmE domain-containing protein n=1 Tax=Sphingobacterium sp. SGG-5 TaxID=2710881 RepID=UPI0013ED7220|nr:cytochrome c maturation protein CcmE [Sphingobacterium sp. SGG-5]NGM60314.1 cytochrome c maturation protein CcmE [Sphingobacterium sp. SGG-5]
MKKSSIILIVIIAIAIAMIMVIYTDSSTYSTFTEAKEKNTELYVVGVLNKEKALIYDPVTDANHFSFYMYDNDSTECKVVFNGSKPQDIERSEQIVLTGKMEGDTFHATKILMKCPSKYNQDQVEVVETTASTF